MNISSVNSSSWTPSELEIDRFVRVGAAPEFLSDPLTAEPLQFPLRLIDSGQVVDQSTVERLLAVQGTRVREPFTNRPLTAQMLRRDSGRVAALDALHAAAERRLRADGEDERAAVLATLRRRCRQAVSLEVPDIEAIVRPWLVDARALEATLGLEPALARDIARAGPLALEACRGLGRRGFPLNQLSSWAVRTGRQADVAAIGWQQLRRDARALTLPTLGLLAGAGLTFCLPYCRRDAGDAPKPAQADLVMAALLGLPAAVFGQGVVEQRDWRGRALVGGQLAMFIWLIPLRLLRHGGFERELCCMALGGVLFGFWCRAAVTVLNAYLGRLDDPRDLRRIALHLQLVSPADGGDNDEVSS